MESQLFWIWGMQHICYLGIKCLVILFFQHSLNVIVNCDRTVHLVSVAMWVSVVWITTFLSMTLGTGKGIMWCACLSLFYFGPKDIGKRLTFTSTGTCCQHSLKLSWYKKWDYWHLRKIHNSKFYTLFHCLTLWRPLGFGDFREKNA